MKTKVNLALAIKLREEGLSYKQISAELGCSIDWCKRNLSNTTKNKLKEEKIRDLVIKAQQPEALTKSEIRLVVLETDRPESNMTKLQFNEEVRTKVNNIASKINKKEGTIIRPTWMNPNNAESCYYKLAEFAEILDAQLDELVNSYFMETGTEVTEWSKKSFLCALLQISKASQVMNVSPTTLLTNYEEIARKLVERNGDSGYIEILPKICVIKENEVTH